MDCNCSSRAQRDGPRRRLNLARVWPEDCPFPPCTPWLAAAIKREDAQALISGTRALAGGATDTLALADGVTGPCPDDPGWPPECEHKGCITGWPLSDMAQAWYEEGGLATLVVETLFHQIALDECETNHCDELVSKGVGDNWTCGFERTWFCRAKYEVEVEGGGLAFKRGWVFFVQCCCTPEGTVALPPQPPRGFGGDVVVVGSA